jgi:pilus assembly protein CpaB
LIYNYLQKRTAPKEVALETQPVAVAVANLPWGTAIKKEMVKVEPYLKKSLPGGYISDPSALEGRVVISPIAANEPILQSRLAPVDLKTGGVAAVVKPKNRAVAVRVDKIIGVAGFIYPGNRVDVLVTIDGGKGVPEPITKIVLENILVLASGADVQKGGKEAAQASPVDVITLEVTPEETEKLAHAATQGKLQLALRNYQDTEDVLTRGARTPALLASYAGVGEAPKAASKQGKRVTTVKAPSPIQPAVFSVEVVRGGQSSKVNFEGR